MFGLDTLLIMALIASAASAAYSIDSANKQAAWQTKQIEEQRKAEIAEYGREAEMLNRQSVEEKSDLMREMEKAFASARLASAEGFGAIDRSIYEISDAYGTDLARMEANRVNRGDALHSGAKASTTNAAMGKATAKFDRDAKRTSAALGFLNSAVSYGAQYKIGQAKAS